MSEYNFERVANRFLYGAIELSIEDFAKSYKPLFDNGFIDKKKKELDYEKFWLDFVIIEITNKALRRSSRYFDKLLFKLQFVSDWEYFLKSEINRYLIKLDKQRGKVGCVSDISSNILFDKKSYLVDGVTLKHLNICDIAEVGEDDFFYFVKDSFGYNIRRIIRNRDNEGFSIQMSINEILKKLAFKGVDTYSEYETVQNGQYFTKLIKPIYEKEIYLVSVYVGNYYLSKLECDEVIKDYSGYVKYFSLCYYLFYMKNCLVNKRLDANVLRGGFFGIPNYKYDTNGLLTLINESKRIKEGSLSFKSNASVDKIRNLHKKIIASHSKIIENVSFEKFFRIFQNVEMNDEDKLKWCFKKNALAYFIGKLRDESFIEFHDFLWQKTENCFLDINQKNIKASYGEGANLKKHPEQFKIIDSLFI